MHTNTTMIKGMAALFGFGYALLLSSTFKRISIITNKLGYKDDSNTNLVITSKFVNSTLIDDQEH